MAAGAAPLTFLLSCSSLFYSTLLCSAVFIASHRIASYRIASKGATSISISISISICPPVPSRPYISPLHLFTGGDEYCYTCFKTFHSKGKGRKKHKKESSRHSWVGFSTGTSVHVCTECAPEKVTIAAKFCQDCEDYFCNSCFASLHERGPVKDHRCETLCTQPGPPPAPIVDLDVDVEENPPPLVPKRSDSAVRNARAAKLALSRRIRPTSNDRKRENQKEFGKPLRAKLASDEDDLDSGFGSSTDLGRGSAKTVGVAVLIPANTGGLPIDAFRMYLRECEDGEEEPTQYYPEHVTKAKEHAAGSVARIQRAEDKVKAAEKIVYAATKTTADFEWIRESREHRSCFHASDEVCLFRLLQKAKNVSLVVVLECRVSRNLRFAPRPSLCSFALCFASRPSLCSSLFAVLLAPRFLRFAP